tara:strand:- start:346 stop:525 length:180 start_codon:yes stop_codon:yes gene_type:complete
MPMPYRVFFYTDSTGFVSSGIGQTKVYVGQPLKTLKGAMNKVNRLDNDYGGYKYRYEKF